MQLGVFPAGAGVILIRKEGERMDIGVPRRCGGDPRKKRIIGVQEPCSPQVRG